MHRYIQEAMAQWRVPGRAITVVKDGETVVARGYGICEVDRDRRVTEDTVFAIASCTKSFTAACLAMLVDEGKLNWDDPLKKHLASFQVRDSYVTRHATLRDVLAHRTGLVRGDLLIVKGDLTHRDILSSVRLLSQEERARASRMFFFPASGRALR